MFSPGPPPMLQEPHVQFTDLSLIEFWLELSRKFSRAFKLDESKSELYFAINVVSKHNMEPFSVRDYTTEIQRVYKFNPTQAYKLKDSLIDIFVIGFVDIIKPDGSRFTLKKPVSNTLLPPLESKIVTTDKFVSASRRYISSIFPSILNDDPELEPAYYLGAQNTLFKFIMKDLKPMWDAFLEKLAKQTRSDQWENLFEILWQSTTYFVILNTLIVDTLKSYNSADITTIISATNSVLITRAISDSNVLHHVDVLTSAGILTRAVVNDMTEYSISERCRQIVSDYIQDLHIITKRLHEAAGAMNA